MNSLAQAVHAVVVGGKSVEDVSRGLTTQERAALADMLTSLQRLPQDLARVLAAEPTQSEWARVAPAVQPTQS